MTRPKNDCILTENQKAVLAKLFLDKSENGTEIDWLGLKLILDHIIQNGNKIEKKLQIYLFSPICSIRIQKILKYN